MINKFRIYAVCGSGVATSTLLANRLKAGLQKEGIVSFVIMECSIRELERLVQNSRPDFIIYTTPIDTLDLEDIKSFSGLPILMNKDTAALYKEIASYLKTKESRFILK